MIHRPIDGSVGREKAGAVGGKGEGVGAGGGSGQGSNRHSRLSLHP